jgi:N-methylhydantoinase A
MALRVGIDVGGTFTDLFLHDDETGAFWLAKTPSTPEDQSLGVLEGIRQVCERAAIEPSRLDQILHGTTVATNAVLEGKGARVGLLITEGWAHLLHLAESWTPGPLFGFFNYIKPEPLVDFEDIREIPERISARGEVLTPLDEAAVATAVDELVARDVEALTVCLLNSYANADHERRVEAIAGPRTRGVPISASSRVTPEFREYERVVTTVMNSYVGPVLQRYLTSLEQKLVASSVAAPLQVVRSDGGLQSLAAARDHPVQTVLSGPSGGVNGAAFVASRAGHDRILTFDMGGTSTDVAVCSGGAPTVTRETRVGSFPVRAPSVDVESIGAGGGSIASVSPVTGALRVGPQSAGADPGPACYGRGGTDPTVTDANVVLGHLPPRLLGGRIELDVAAAHDAVGRVAEEMGVDVHRAAEGIVAIVNENMLGALRVATVQKGLDPKDFALVSFGGAGGLHANALAATLGCFPVIVPPEPGVLSALGFVAADVRNEFGMTHIRTTERADAAQIAGMLRELAGLGVEWLASEDVAEAQREVSFVLDMRYYRQGYELPIEVSASELESLDLTQVADRFRASHERLYGFSLPGAVELVNLRARALGRVRKPELPDHPGTGPDASRARTGTQQVWSGGSPAEVPLYDRERLESGMRIEGQAVVTQYDATTLVLPGHVATVDRWLNLLIEPAQPAGA